MKGKRKEEMMEEEIENIKGIRKRAVRKRKDAKRKKGEIKEER